MIGRLTQQQSYLLERLPKKYNLGIKYKEEPIKIKNARKLIKDYDDNEVIRRDKLSKKFEKSIEEVKEAILFSPINDALKKLKELEAEVSQS
jgi:hypothetical protein